MAERDAERARQDAPAEQDVKVTDRRLFTLDGQLRHRLPDEVEEPPKETPPATTPTAAESRAPRTGDGNRTDFAHEPVEESTLGVDFTMLLNAMAQPALLFLGEIPHPATGQPRIDLEQARIQIDMLQVLRVKCRGNLTPDEEALLDRILYQLRMLYVHRASDVRP